MSRVIHLVADLTALASECKKKAPNVRIECDKFVAHYKLHDLNTLLATLTLAPEDTECLQNVIIGLCASENAKVLLLTLPVAQKVFNFKLVSPGLLPPVLDALAKAAALTPEILLRILQCLPPLISAYFDLIGDESFIKILSICCTLTKQIKFPAVQNTASATLQQLLNDVFDENSTRNKDTDVALASLSQTFKTDTDVSITLSGRNLKMFLIFQDLCFTANGKAPSYLPALSLIKTALALEIIESILSRHRALFETEHQMAYLVRAELVPILLNIINSQTRRFSVTVRAVRICHSLISFTRLAQFEVECELIMSCLNHLLLNAQKSKPDWEMHLILELYRGLFADFKTTKVIFDTFDARPQKRGIIKEFVLILSNFLSEVVPISPCLNPPAMIQVPDLETHQPSQEEPLFSDLSNMKIAIIDHLDKLEPPSDIPHNYHVSLAFTILISLAEGTSTFVQSLSTQSGGPHLENDVEFISGFLRTIHADVFAVFKRFLFTLLDNDGFRLLVRAMQRFAHAIGILGLKQQLDEYLALLAIAITTNSTAGKPSKSKTSVTNLQELGKQLLAFGGSLVESLSSSLNNSLLLSGQETKIAEPNTSAEEHLNISRAMHARQVVCLHALTNLAISLGSTLEDSWLIVWKAFQWCNYYIAGPDEYSGNSQQKLLKYFTTDMMPTLSSGELEGVAALQAKLINSLANLPSDSYMHVLQALIALSLDLFGEDKSVVDDPKWPEHLRKVNASQSFASCPFNKTFYLNAIKEVSELNPVSFLLSSDEVWQMVLDYFVRLGTNRSMGCSFRTLLMNAYYDIVKRLASTGFSDVSVDIHTSTSTKTLHAICSFLKALFALELPRELLVLNCETELHLLSLTTLHDLIDKYDTHYTHSCRQVFWILNTPFRDQAEIAEVHNLDDKKQLLVNSSFSTLKLILDEFLSTLPFDQLKPLVDSLCHFGAQHYDLNTSFSAISYFWLISDSIKLRMGHAETSNDDKLLSIDPTETGLCKFLDYETPVESLEFYCVLDIYLLHALIKPSSDCRSQVRDCSIQTLYQIVDAHTPTLQSVPGAWYLTYNAVIIRILETEMDFNRPEFHTKEWVDSIGLHLTGLVSLCNKFMVGNDPANIDKWRGIVGFLQVLASFRWPAFNMNVFRAFHDLLIPYLVGSCDPPVALQVLCFDFWVNIPTDYDLMDKLYAESMVVWLRCFGLLYPLAESIVDDERIAAVLSKLNKCALYPVLPRGQSDSEKPTVLQRSVLEILRTLSTIGRFEVQSSIVLLLSQLMVSPYSTRDQLKSKLTGTSGDNLGARALFENSQIPTFTALAHLCTTMLDDMLRQNSNFDALLKPSSLYHVFGSLLDIIDHHSVGIHTDSPLWVEACKLVEYTTEKMLAANKASEPGYYSVMWELVLRAMRLRTDVTHVNGNARALEQIQLAHFDRMSSIVVPCLPSFGKPNEVIAAYVGQLYRESFFYEFDELEQWCLEEIEDPFTIEGAEEMVQKLSLQNGRATFELARPLMPKPFTASHAHCLEKLSELCGEMRIGGDLGARLRELAHRYCMCRALLVMRRMASAARMWSRLPVTKLFSREVTSSLQATIYNDTEMAQTSVGNVMHLYAGQLIPHAERVEGLAQLLTGIIRRTHSARQD